MTTELRREVEQLGSKIHNLPDTWGRATKSFRRLLDNPVENDHAWNEKVKNRVRQVVTVAEAIYKFEILDQTLRDEFARYCTLPLDLPTETSALIRSLRMWCPARQARPLTDKLREHIKQIEDELEELYSRALELLETWESATGDFHECVIKPVYGKCLLVMGRTGSGKTHLVACLLQSHERTIEGYELYCLYVPFEPKTTSHGDLLPIDQVLKDAASFEYPSVSQGPRWRTLGELARFVSETKAAGNRTGRLVIILDDLDSWVRDRRLDLEALHEFIEQHTTLHHVYWVLCLSEADYSLVAGREFERFWGQYGFVGQPYMPTPSGWTGLDTLNEQFECWRAIIHYKLGGKELPPDLTSALDKMSRQLLANPFIAWLVGDLIKEDVIQALPNLNYIDFVERFWSRRLDQLLPEEFRGQDMHAWASRFWRGIYLIAALVVKDKELAAIKENTVVIGQRALSANLVKADQGKTLEFTEEVVERIIEGLRRMAVLVRLEDPETIAIHGNQLRLEVLPLWQWQSGRYLAEQLSANASVQDRMEAWLRRYFEEGPSQIYLEGVLEFLILLIARGKYVIGASQPDLSENLAQLLSREVLHLPQPYESVLWLAASKATGVYQYQLASWLERSGKVSFVRKGDLHRYLYFLKYTELPVGGNSGVSALLRLQLLRPYYRAIQDFKYGEYFQGFLKSVVENAKDGGDIARAFAYLYGIEEFLDEDTYWSCAKELAEWTYDSLWRLAERVQSELSFHTVHQWMLQFLAEVSKLGPSSKEYERHWVLMTRCHCNFLAEGLTIGVLTWLETNEWFKWSAHTLELSDNVLFVMEEQLTTACGTWFREQATNRQKEDYVEAVKGWADGSADQKGVAIFLIYHTVPSEGPYQNLPVPPDLWEIFNRLRNDSDEKVQRIIKILKIKQWYERQEGLRVTYESD